MALPPFQDLMLPILDLCGDGQDHAYSEVELIAWQSGFAQWSRLQDDDGLVPTRLTGWLPDPAFWAVVYLLKAGLLEKRGTCHLRITYRGRQVLRMPPARIDIKLLAQFPEFRAFLEGAQSRRLDEKDVEQKPLLGEPWEAIYRDFHMTQGVMPVRNNEELSCVNARLEGAYPYGHYPLYGVILYSAADANVASFVRWEMQEIHYLSGRFLLFYVVERFIADWRPLVEAGLTDVIGPYATEVVQCLRQESDAPDPVDVSQTIEIGKHFAVKPSQWPCIVFFTDYDSKEVLIVPFASLLDPLVAPVRRGDLIRIFRRIGEAAQEVAGEDVGKRLPLLRTKLGLDHTLEQRLEKAKPVAKAVLEGTVKAAVEAVVKALLTGGH